jgi:signal transduction histidine kinase/ActR/RegA family two-component response regulator
MTTSAPERVLVLAPRGRDAELIRKMLAEHALVVETFPTADELVKRLDDDASCAIATFEAIESAFRGSLGRVLKSQSPWSDFPIIVLSAPNQTISEEVGNITLLERPIAPNTLLVTVRAALRARRRQYQARTAIQQRDQFLAMLGHELRNPLGAIVMATDLIGMDSDRANVSKRMAILSRQAHHLSRLVDDLLEVARVTTGKVRLQREPLAIDDLVRTGIDAASESTRAREITTTTVATSGAIVDGDPVRLAQVINNLIGNAIKYSGDARAIEIGTYLTEDGVELRVTDHGIGIEHDMLGRVFELFAQAEGGLARSEGGMGIGLTLVDRLVRLHGGVVAAQSEGRGKGSQFVVQLPVIQTQPAVAALPVAIPQGTDPVRVVVVEDSADLRELSVSMLETLGCAVDAAATGPDGLAMILRAAPEVAIIDIGLPGMTGFEVARAVRTTSASPILLVAMTGYGRKEDRDQAIAAGFDLHFAKPVQATRLRELVARVRARREAA